MYCQPLEGKFTEPLELPIQYPFELDDFQKHCGKCVINKQDVLLTAHTSAGKTVVAEIAIAYFTGLGYNVAYTSPIKALSNQKYKDLANKFPRIRVGISTGDIELNPDAQCIVMTTEKLRNALFRNSKSDITQEFIDNMKCVIFDEVHYIKDESRGHVWEETLMMLPADVTLVMLSATINRAEQFANWVGQNRKKPVYLVTTDYRPTPLEHCIYFDKTLYPVMNNAKQFNELQYQEFKQDIKLFLKEGQIPSEISVNNQLIEYLQQQKLTPCIFFCFSKKKCEFYARHIHQNLVESEVSKEIVDIYQYNLHKYQAECGQQYLELLELLKKGIAFHHAGMVPMLREIVEIIFQKGLIKLLFATETLAVGLNMPTKSVVMMQLTKFSDNGKRFLNTDEYTQMAGRAGRRGLDKSGKVIILPTYEMIHGYCKNFLRIMQGSCSSVTPKMKIDFHLVLKILNNPLISPMEFLNKSMSGLEISQQIRQNQEKLTELEAKDKTLAFKCSEMDQQLYEEYYEEQQLREQFAGSKMRIQLSGKKGKNAKSLTSTQKAQLGKYIEWKKLQESINDATLKITNLHEYIAGEVETAKLFLKHFGYIDDTDKLTSKGELAVSINECNPFLLTELILQKQLHDLEPRDIIAIISFFVEDKGGDQETLPEISDGVKFAFDFLRKQVETFSNYEETIGSKFHLMEYWKLNLSFADLVYLWSTIAGPGIATSSESEINMIDKLASRDIYQGMFIKVILKINNICKDLITICEKYDVSMIPKLEQIETMIVHSFVSPRSLYINK